MAKKKSTLLSYKSIKYLFLLLFATIFMGIGYASINGVFVTIDGEGRVLTKSGLYITDVSYVSNNGADLSVSKINDFNGKVLNSTIKLGTNSNSTITYSITITNNTNNSSSFVGTSYSNNFYDNPNITFQLSNLSVGDTLSPGASKTFNITFQYTGNNTSNQVLNSYIAFDFDNFYTITYEHINTTGHNYPTIFLASETSKTITFTGDVPYDVSITPNTINYSYNNGVLTLNNVSENITIDRYYGIVYTTTGTNPSGQPTKYLHGQTVNFLSPTDGVNRFEGWYTNSSYSGNPISNTAGLNEDLHLYAKWTNPYTITYVLNGGVQASNQPTYFFTDTPQNIQNPSNTHDPEFGGWYQNSGLTGTSVTSTSSLSGNSTLYAKWQSTIANTTYNSTTNRFVASNASNVTIANFKNLTYTENSAHTTVNSVKVYVTYKSSNKSSVLTCQVGGDQATINISTNQNNGVGEATINLSTPIQAGSSYTISCPSSTGSGNLKITINGFEFIINP